MRSTEGNDNQPLGQEGTSMPVARAIVLQKIIEKWKG